MPTPIAKTSPQKTIPQRMSRRYILNQCCSSLSIIVNLAFLYTGHHDPYAGEPVVDHVLEPLGFGCFVLDTDKELSLVFGTVYLSDVIEGLFIVFSDEFSVGLQDVQRVSVAGDNKCILCVHYYSDSRDLGAT